MNIRGHEISQHVIENYLRACKYNQCAGTAESDLEQRAAHNAVFAALNISFDSPDYDLMVRVIDELVNDLLIKGY